MKSPATKSAEPIPLSRRISKAPFVVYFHVFLRAHAAEHGVHLGPIWCPDLDEVPLPLRQAHIRGR